MTYEENVKPPQRPKWSLTDVIIVLIILLALIPLARIFKGYLAKVITVLMVTGNSPETLALFLGSFLQSLTMALAIVIIARIRGASGRDLGLVWDSPVYNIVLGLLGGVALGVSVWFIGALISTFFGPPPPQDIEKLLTGLKSGKDLFLPFISVSVFAPLSEELYFRGMVYPVIRARLGPLAGMVLSGLFFGALHLDVYRLVPIGFMGFALAYFYERTGSLVTCIVAHSAWNTLMIILLFLVVNR